MYYLFTDDNNSDWQVNSLKAYQGTGYYLLLFGLQERIWRVVKGGTKSQFPA